MLPSKEDSHPISLIGSPFPLVFEYKKKPNSSPTVKSAAETSYSPHFPFTAFISIPFSNAKSDDIVFEMSFAPTFSQFPGSNDNLSTGEHAAESVITLGVADSSPNFAASKLDVVVDLPRKNKGAAAREAYPLILTVILSEEEEGEEEVVVVTANVANNTKTHESKMYFALREKIFPLMVLLSSFFFTNKGVVSIILCCCLLLYRADSRSRISQNDTYEERNDGKDVF